MHRVFIYSWTFIIYSASILTAFGKIVINLTNGQMCFVSQYTGAFKQIIVSIENK